jgi:hypothetical protein
MQVIVRDGAICVHLGTITNLFEDFVLQGFTLDRG